MDLRYTFVNDTEEYIYAKKENKSFSEMVKRCYKPRTWNENANIIYLHKDTLRTTIVPHACYYLDEAEENKIFDLLKRQIRDQIILLCF